MRGNPRCLMRCWAPSFPSFPQSRRRLASACSEFIRPKVSRSSFLIHQASCHARRHFIIKLCSQSSHSFDDADVILVLAEATLSPERALPKEWKKYTEIAGKKPIVLGLSKVDLFKDKKKILPTLAQYGAMNIFSDIIPISSKKKYNITQLVEVLHKYLPSDKAFYDTDQLSDQNERFFASELIREAIFHEFREEIPYSTEVVIMDYSEREEGKWFISADILVERDSQKSILIGKGGETLKNLGARARKSIEQFVEHPIYLELHVKAKSDWRNDKNALREMGYGV